MEGMEEEKVSLTCSTVYPVTVQMGKNKWHVNSAFKVTSADIEAHNPLLWGQTHNDPDARPAVNLNSFLEYCNITLMFYANQVAFKCHFPQIE